MHEIGTAYYDGGVEGLAVAIVRQAIADYRRARQVYNDETADAEEREEAQAEIREIERFFLSEWGDMVTFGKAEMILAEIQKEFRSGAGI